MEANVSLSAILFSIAIFLGIVLFIILTWVNKNQVHSSRLLGFYVLLFSFFAFHNLTLYTGYIIHWPHLYRTPRPFNYLPGIIVFLYIRSLLYGEQRFRKLDFLHFLPVIFCAIDLIPFFFESKEEKLDQIRYFLSNTSSDGIPKGWLPVGVHNMLIPVLNIIYAAACVRMLSNASKSKNLPLFRQNKLVFQWLKAFGGIYFFFFAIWYLVYAFKSPLPDSSIMLTQALIAAILSISTGVALLFYPNILYGFQGKAPLSESPKEPIVSTSHEVEKEEPSIVLSDALRKKYIDTLERRMNTEHLYLNSSYSLTDLAASTNIPYYYLSAVINQEYGWNFNEYINSFRINHFKRLMEKPEANQYTLEAIAQQSGFGSRITFTRAFKKFEGCTPSEYLKRTEAAN